ncbi:hypothetical protein [Humibacillus xanthopallidus]|uniref:hypothetical protein n=1 Tax=Humibacillus xanthopallidus TaxID=412689 RepID=UPI00163AD5BD|nr:hypothetical protein [Humibacillus xanthopallidus]
MAGLTGLVGALLFYFGWARAASTFSYFGIELDVLDLSFRDYVLRSVGSAYWPAAMALVVVLFGLVVHQVLRQQQKSLVIGLPLLVLGAIAVAVGAAAVAGIVIFRTAWPVVPVLLLSGSIVAAYGGWWLSRRSDERTAVGGGGPSAQGVVRAMVTMLILVLGFWTVSSYASYRGMQVAQDLAANLQGRPAVMLLSSKDLHITGAGTLGVEISDDSAQYRYCYTGLRLLIRSGGRYILAPEEWRRGRDPVIVVPDSSGVRFDFYKSRTVPRCAP